MHISRKLRLALLLVPFALSASLLAVAVSRATESSACDAPNEALVESKEFTPFEARFTQLDPVIDTEGVPDGQALPDLDGLPLAWTAGGGGGALYQYFLGSPIEGNVTVSEFFASGGMQLDRDPVDNGESFAKLLLSAEPDRAIAVQVGEHAGALVWADPLANGLRPHHLYWSDKTYNYSLIADIGAEELVTLGRGLVCGGALAS